MTSIKYIIVFFSFYILFGCSHHTNQESSKQVNEEELNLLDFKESNDFETLCLAKGLSYEVLFQSGDSIIAPNGEITPSKNNFDCNVLLPSSIDSNEAQLFVSFETSHSFNEDLGNGGGGMIMNLLYDTSWKIMGSPSGIDYSSVDQTINNCGGKTTPYGTILSAEEYCVDNIDRLMTDMGKDYDSKTYPYQHNFGWMVEIDPKTKKATQKIKSFGRYVHEDAYCMPDGKTVYLTNDDAPAILFKFIADSINDYSQGQLYGFSQEKKWLPIPMLEVSLLNARNEAIKLGATLFTRHEWLTVINNRLYITETGKDNISYDPYLKMGGTLPSYYDSSFVDDPYGRVLCLDLKNDSLSIELEGGKYEDYFFSNPDCITSYHKDGHDYLMINEDINGTTRGRSITSEASNDLFRYNLATKELEKVLRSPLGSETTGGIFDGKGNYFLNIQHPNENNKEPFNKSSLIVIKGL